LTARLAANAADEVLGTHRGEGGTWDRVVDLLSEAKLTYCCVDEPQQTAGSGIRD
jgi:hypothetical protein